MFAHAIVPITVADAVFLDKQWKRRLERIDLPFELPRIYYGTQAAEFLDWFENVTLPYEDGPGILLESQPPHVSPESDLPEK